MSWKKLGLVHYPDVQWIRGWSLKLRWFFLRMIKEEEFSDVKNARESTRVSNNKKRMVWKFLKQRRRWVFTPVCSNSQLCFADIVAMSFRVMVVHTKCNKNVLICQCLIEKVSVRNEKGVKIEDLQIFVQFCWLINYQTVSRLTSVFSN